MDSQICTLNWQMHNAEFFHGLEQLRKEAIYSDATIACNGEFFAVHKFVLSTGSNYFKDIFSRMDSSSPMVIIKDITAKDMRYLLDFIYLGKVDISTSEMGSFARAAECLKVKGFTTTNDQICLPPVHKVENDSFPEPKRIKTIHIVSSPKVPKVIQKPIINPNSSLLNIGTTEVPTTVSPTSKKFVPSPVIQVTTGNLSKPNLIWSETQEVQNLTAPPTIISQPSVSDELSEAWEEITDPDVVMEQNASSIKKEKTAFPIVAEPKEEKNISCDLCGRKFKKLKYLNLHMKTHTGEKPHECEICGFRSLQSGVMTRHLRKHTGEKPFVCQFCDYKSSQKGALQRHKKLKHFSIYLVDTNT